MIALDVDLGIRPAAYALLARKLDHGRAEAALIALYDLRNSRLTATPPGAKPGPNRDDSHLIQKELTNGT
jgi:hypothetical protein